MNKVITINLHGIAFQLEEGGYDALRAYLDGAALRLDGNPDKDEIMADIEQAIADKCRVVLGAYRNVVMTQEITQIIEEMGPVQDAAAEGDERPAGATDATAAGAPAGASGSGAAASESAPPPRGRRLYKIHEGAMFAGVCNGLGVYFGIDPTLVRVLFVLLTFFWGFAILVYLVLMIILPSPETPADKAAAYGVAATAQEFIKRAREGYYEGRRTWGDRHARREWRRRFKREMHGWGQRLQREMHESAYRWQQNWDQRSMAHPPRVGGSLIFLPILALLRGCLALVGIFAVVSLITTGAVFGLPLPLGIPVWLGVIVLIVVYNIVVAPLKALRHAWYWHGAYGPHPGAAFFGLVDAIIFLGSLVLLIWLADRYVPHAHEALQNLPPAIHHAADTVKQWWATR